MRVPARRPRWQPDLEKVVRGCSGQGDEKPPTPEGRLWPAVGSLSREEALGHPPTHTHTLQLAWLSCHPHFMVVHSPLRIKNILTRRRGSRRDAGGGAGTAASCSLSPWPLCLPWEGAASLMPLVPVCQTLQVKEQEKAQLPLDQTSWNKFASHFLLTGCAASAAEIGGLDGAVMGVGDQCGICNALLCSMGWGWRCFGSGARLLSLYE